MLGQEVHKQEKVEHEVCPNWRTVEATCQPNCAMVQLDPKGH